MDKTYEDMNKWLIELKAEMSNEEYIRLNYNQIIDSIIKRVVEINAQKSGKLLNSLLEPLMKTMDYNRRHPSPQRSICFVETIDILSDKLVITLDELTANFLNTQNLLMKVMKLMLKDNNSDDYNTQIIIKITDKMFKFLQIIRVLPKLEPNLVIVLNNLILNTIRCIYLLINNFNYDIKTRDFNQFCGQMLGILKTFAFYGIPGYDVSQVRSSVLFPSPFIQLNELKDGFNERKGSVNKSRNKKSKNKTKLNNEDLEDDSDCIPLNDRPYVRVLTSDSEFSSSDYETTQTSDDFRVQKSTANKIRHISYESLSSALSLFDKKVIFGFWSNFIQSSTPGSLLWSISREPSSRVKASALNFLHRLLMTGNPYVITLADSSTKTTKYMSFTPLSLSLAQMVAQIHNEMHSILFAETNTSVLVQTFKCLSLLVAISPYKKLESGLLCNLFAKSLSLLRHKDIQIQNSCLALSVKIFELEPFPEEMKTFIETNDGIKSLNIVLDHSCDSIMNKQSILLCGESLKLLTTILKQRLIIDYLLNCEEIHLSLELLTTVSMRCLENESFISNLVIQSLVCKYLFSLGTVLKTRNTTESLERHKNWWLSVLNSKLIVSAINRADPSIPQSTQCLIIDFISTISSDIFESFEPKMKFHLISVLISILRNNDSIAEDMSCQSAAIRCLGVYQSFKSMTEDLNYLFDVSMIAIEIIDNFSETYFTKKSSHLLLYQSSWTLANFCDILKKSYLDNTSDIKTEFLLRLITTISDNFDIQFTNSMQNENIKTNFVRCSGSALYLVLIREERHKTIDFKRDSSLRYHKLIVNLVEKWVNTLKNSKSFKLQWNICIAFTYLLEINSFVELCQTVSHLPEVENIFVTNCDQQLIDKILDTLFSVMKSSRNHKVQSYAVYALCSPISHPFSEDNFKQLFISISNFMVDNYTSVPVNIRDNWLEKFCVSINKLVDKYFNHNIESDSQIMEIISNLKEFLTNESLFRDSAQNNPEFVVSLIDNLNKSKSYVR